MVDQSIRDLESMWNTFDHENGLSVRKDLEDVFPDLVQTYALPAAGLAVAHYEGLREAQGIKTSFTSTIAPPRAPEAAVASARWAISPLFKGAAANAPAALVLLSGVTQRLVLQAARDTLIENTFKDKSKPMYARNPAGRDTCKFCITLAGRGAVYVSAKSAGYHNDFHDNCWCEPEPIWDNDALPYDPEPYYEMYKDHHEPGMTLKEVMQNWK